MGVLTIRTCYYHVRAYERQRALPNPRDWSVLATTRRIVKYARTCVRAYGLFRVGNGLGWGDASREEGLFGWEMVIHTSYFWEIET